MLAMLTRSECPGSAGDCHHRTPSDWELVAREKQVTDWRIVGRRDFSLSMV